MLTETRKSGRFSGFGGFEGLRPPDMGANPDPLIERRALTTEPSRPTLVCFVFSREGLTM